MCMKPFDARCINCGNVHIIWVSDAEEEGDVIKFLHKSRDGKACGEYGAHQLEAELVGLKSECGEYHRAG